VINAAIDACPDYGTVYVKGDVGITSQITVDPYKSLFFDVIGTETTNIDMIVVDGGATSTRMYNFVIGKSLQFPENYTKSALKIKNAKDVHVNIRNIRVDTGVGCMYL